MIRWVLEGLKVNQEYYREVVIELRERVRKKIPDFRTTIVLCEAHFGEQPHSCT